MARTVDQQRWRNKTDSKRVEVYLPVDILTILDEQTKARGFKGRGETLASLIRDEVHGTPEPRAQSGGEVVQLKKRNRSLAAENTRLKRKLADASIQAQIAAVSGNEGVQVGKNIGRKPKEERDIVVNGVTCWPTQTKIDYVTAWQVLQFFKFVVGYHKPEEYAGVARQLMGDREYTRGWWPEGVCHFWGSICLPVYKADGELNIECSPPATKGH